MSSLTTFSKTLITIAAIGVTAMMVVMCYNCTKNSQYNQPTHVYNNPSPVQDYGTHQVITQPGGTQVVVVKDHSGAEFFMDYLMFQSLMNMSGGMNNVYNYRDQHRYDRDWDERQTQYKTTSKTVVNNYYGTSVDDSKSFTEQVKQKDIEYKASAGFKSVQSTPSSTSPTNSGTKSNGFTEKHWPSNVPTSTPEPTYKSSPGFKSSTPSSTYTPSSGFKSSGSTSTGGTSYKPSGGFKSSTPSSSSSGSSYKPSSGFKKKN